MRKQRADRYDYAFQALAVILTFLILAFAREQGWSWLTSLGFLLVLSIPVGLALGWLKARLQARRHNLN